LQLRNKRQGSVCCVDLPVTTRDIEKSSINVEGVASVHPGLVPGKRGDEGKLASARIDRVLVDFVVMAVSAETVDQRKIRRPESLHIKRQEHIVVVAHVKVVRQLLGVWRLK